MEMRPVGGDDLPRIRMLLEAFSHKLWGGEHRTPLAEVLRSVHDDRGSDQTYAAETDDDLFVKREFNHAMMVLEALELHDGQTLDVGDDWDPPGPACLVDGCPESARLDFCPRHRPLRPF